MLCTAMILAAAAPVAAAAPNTQACECSTIPIIDIAGINSSPLYYQNDAGETVTAFPPSGDSIKGAVKSVLPSLLKYIFTRNAAELERRICDAVNAIFSPMSCDAEGNSVHEMTINPQEEITVEKHTQDGYYYFIYDWRVDPLETRDKLAEYIDEVISATGHGKVCLAPQSFGGIITMSYLKKHGFEKVDSVILRSSAFQGITFAGEIFTRNVELNSKSVAGFLSDMLIDGGNEKAAKLITSAERIGLFKPLFLLAGRIINRLLDPLYDGSLCEIFARMPGMWAMMPDEYYEDAKKAMLIDGIASQTLVDRIDYYHNEIQAKAKEILDDGISRGVKVAVAAKYGRYGIPVGRKSLYTCDGMVDLPCSSGGAKCALLGETLGENYVQSIKCGHNHLSPDGVIDASTCLYPEYTWFFKGLEHNSYSAEFRELVAFIANSKTQPTVFTAAKHPQFN